jgi:hypothetical protein
MAKPIKEIKELKGKDADRFADKMLNAEKLLNAETKIIIELTPQQLTDIFDQQNKVLGLPTTDDIIKQNLLFDQFIKEIKSYNHKRENYNNKMEASK